MIGPIQSQAASQPKPLLRLGGEHPFELFEKDLSEAAKKELSKLKKASADIEAIFAKKLLSEMMPKGVGGEGAMGDFVRDQMLDALAQTSGRNGALGLSRMLHDKLSETIYRQEAARILLTRPTEEPKP